MATFHFDLVSPEKLLFAGDVGQVDLPGAEGDLGVLAGHAPLVTALRPGIIVMFRDGGDLRVVVNGGFAEVGPGGPDRAGRHGGAGRGVRSRRCSPARSRIPRKTSPTRPTAGSATSSPTASINCRRCRLRWRIRARAASVPTIDRPGPASLRRVRRTYLPVKGVVGSRNDPGGGPGGAVPCNGTPTPTLPLSGGLSGGRRAPCLLRRSRFSLGIC